MEESESAEVCQLLCQIKKGCMTFTYKLSTKECWLKTTDSGRRVAAGSISGKKYCNGDGV